MIGKKKIYLKFPWIPEPVLGLIEDQAWDDVRGYKALLKYDSPLKRITMYFIFSLLLTTIITTCTAQSTPIAPPEPSEAGDTIFEKKLTKSIRLANKLLSIDTRKSDLIAMLEKRIPALYGNRAGASRKDLVALQTLCSLAKQSSALASLVKTNMENSLTVAIALAQAKSLTNVTEQIKLYQTVIPNMQDVDLPEKNAFLQALSIIMQHRGDYTHDDFDSLIHLFEQLDTAKVLGSDQLVVLQAWSTECKKALALTTGAQAYRDALVGNAIAQKNLELLTSALELFTPDTPTTSKNILINGLNGLVREQSTLDKQKLSMLLKKIAAMDKVIVLDKEQQDVLGMWIKML